MCVIASVCDRVCVYLTFMVLVVCVCSWLFGGMIVLVCLSACWGRLFVLCGLACFFGRLCDGVLAFQCVCLLV